MWKKISLLEYLNLGGEIENVDWEKSECTYSDKNRGKRVVSYENLGHRGGGGMPCYVFNFEDGTEHRYAISWIAIDVKFSLDRIYLEPKSD